MVGARAENRAIAGDRAPAFACEQFLRAGAAGKYPAAPPPGDERDAMPYKTLGARVVARTPSFLSNVIYIDRGSKDGVRNDAPVISGDGIVGRTVLVSRTQSQVQLITNPDASVGVMTGANANPGSLEGIGGFPAGSELHRQFGTGRERRRCLELRIGRDFPQRACHWQSSRFAQGKRCIPVHQSAAVHGFDAG